MLIPIPSVLTAEEVADARRILETADWVDGRVTAGHQSVRTKNNMQIPEDHPASREVGEMILRALGRSELFISAALPSKVFPPLFNRYSGGQSFGPHVDNAIRQISSSGQRIRTDLSATLFFSEPEEYEGGQLLINDAYGTHSVKLPAGHMALYPATSLHQVWPVTRGVRLCSFFWIQSMVRDEGERTLLFDLDTAIQDLNQRDPGTTTAVDLTGVYHNLVRRWADL